MSTVCASDISFYNSARGPDFSVPLMIKENTTIVKLCSTLAKLEGVDCHQIILHFSNIATILQQAGVSPEGIPYSVREVGVTLGQPGSTMSIEEDQRLLAEVVQFSKLQRLADLADYHAEKHMLQRSHVLPKSCLMQGKNPCPIIQDPNDIIFPRVSHVLPPFSAQGTLDRTYNISQIPYGMKEPEVLFFVRQVGNILKSRFVTGLSGTHVKRPYSQCFVEFASKDHAHEFGKLGGKKLFGTNISFQISPARSAIKGTRYNDVPVHPTTGQICEENPPLPHEAFKPQGASPPAWILGEIAMMYSTAASGENPIETLLDAMVLCHKALVALDNVDCVIPITDKNTDLAGMTLLDVLHDQCERIVSFKNPKKSIQAHLLVAAALISTGDFAYAFNVLWSVSNLLLEVEDLTSHKCLTHQIPLPPLPSWVSNARQLVASLTLFIGDDVAAHMGAWNIDTPGNVVLGLSLSKHWTETRDEVVQKCREL